MALPSSSSSVTSTASGSDPVDLGIGDPADVAVAQSRFQDALGVADAAQAEMADIGLGGDKGDWHAVADLALAQIGVGEEREFIGRAEAGSALHGADDDRAGALAETAPSYSRGVAA